MLSEELKTKIGAELVSALEKRGFERLTPVQEAVLEEDVDRDLRISSQTGSGKTVAIGLALRTAIKEGEGTRAIVVTPTRELAKQVEEELAWLYAPLHVRIASVTGGSGYRDELRMLRARPAIVVATPGRLRDHLERGRIEVANVAALVLDEADRMLDMGFREDVEAIAGALPAGHRTHLVSATFPREVKALADSVQDDPVRIEGTPLGTANVDIEHLVHLVHAKERGAAIVNILLSAPGTSTLIFARTRADVADLAAFLDEAGFSIGMLSGEMEQPERNRALAAFKRGSLDALVATDVAARGIDVQDIARVIHAEPPNDADAYTHRSGRTGRAGKKGTSSVLVTPGELSKTSRLLARANVRFRFEPIPSAASIRAAQDESIFAMLTADGEDTVVVDDRSKALAERIVNDARAVARVVALARAGRASEPRDVTPIAPPAPKSGPGAKKNKFERTDRPGRPERHDRHERSPSPRDDGSRVPGGSEAWVAFRVSWGHAHGADPRRLLAMLCRRGNIDGRAIGAIRVGHTYSVVEIASAVADSFEKHTRDPDPRDRRVNIRRWRDDGPPPPPHARERHAHKHDAGGDARPKKKDHKKNAAADRPSARSKASDDRPSAKRVPPDRPSKRNAPADRPSKR